MRRAVLVLVTLALTTLLATDHPSCCEVPVKNGDTVSVPIDPPE